MFDPSAMPRPAMSAERFAALGENRVAYIKAIRSEEVAFLCAEAPLLPPGHRVFVLHAADARRSCSPAAAKRQWRMRRNARSKPSACIEPRSKPRAKRLRVWQCRIPRVRTRCGSRKEIANAYAVGASSGRGRRHRQHGIERFGVA